MEEQLVSLETAKLLKRNGFCNGSDYFYDTTVHFDSDSKPIFNHSPEGFVRKYVNGLSGIILEAPTQSLVQKWLRDKKKIHIRIGHRKDHKTEENLFSVDVKDIKCKNPYIIYASLSYLSTYEEALEEGLKKALQYNQ